MDGQVPCNGCTLCCRGDAVFLHPELGDDPKSYETESYPHPLSGADAPILKHGDDGNCVYLGPAGCTIYDRRPVMCRAFDCRKFFMSMDRNTRRQGVRRKLFDVAVLDRGRELLADAPTKGQK